MKKSKQIIAVFLSAFLFVSLMAGCAGKNGKDSSESSSSTASADQSTTASTSAASEDPFKEHMEISLAIWRAGEALPSDKEDKIRDMIYQKLNITIKPVNITWDDWQQKVQVWAMSNQLPDAFAFDGFSDTSTYVNWIKQGIIQALPDDLSPYPNVKRVVDSEGTSYYKYPMGDPAAKVYAVPRLKIGSAEDSCLDYGVQVRKDWMENVGITKEPENIDEFIALMKAFVEKDPDKDGKNNTIGLAMYDASYLQWIIAAYEPAAYDKWTRDEENPGKWIPPFMTKDYLEGLKAIKKLYVAGGMDKDFATLKGEEGEDKMGNGKAGAYLHDSSANVISYIGDKYEKAFPDKKYKDVVALMKPFKNYKDGKYYRRVSDLAWSETYINAKCDQNKADRILRMCDYFMTDEGYNLTHYGIDGVDYKNEGGQIVLTPQKDASGKDIPLDTTYPIVKIASLMEWSGTRWNVPTLHPEYYEMAKSLRDWYVQNAGTPEADLRLAHLDTPSKGKGTFVAKDFIIQCLMSNDLEKTYNEQVKKFRANGYDKLIEEVNAEAEKLGIK